MKKVLYLTNIEVPYKVRMFNELSKYCDLTVLYERETSSNRNSTWTNSEKIEYNVEYLNGIKIGNEFSFSFRILKHVFAKKYDEIIISCFNSPVQMMLIVILRCLRIQYNLSFDGEIFLEGNGIKTRLKKLFIKGAKKYFTAGNLCSQSLRSTVKDQEIVPYYFSSLTDEELARNKDNNSIIKRNNTVLVIGQYFDYKGMDIALQVAKLNPNIQYKFVGMGKRTEAFIQEQQANLVKNIEIIPFLQKKDLEYEYKKSGLLLLPSRRECWGLVINEASSFGTPIVSTWGSGAAIEFLSEDYPEYLAKSDNAEDLYNKIISFLQSENKEEYSKYLISKSKQYSIQRMVKQHCKALGL